eukprot:g2966.t1
MLTVKAGAVCNLMSLRGVGQARYLWTSNSPPEREWSCDKLAMEADAIVIAIQQATNAGAVAIESGCPSNVASSSARRHLDSGDGSIDARIVLYGGDTGIQQAALVEASLAERYGTDVSPSVAQQSVQQFDSVQPNAAAKQNEGHSGDGSGATTANTSTASVGVIAAAAVLAVVVVAVAAAVTIRRRAAAREMGVAPRASQPDFNHSNPMQTSAKQGADIGDII